MQITDAICLPPGVLGFRQRGQKQRRQNGDDRDDDQQFDKREGKLPRRARPSTDTELLHCE